MYPTRARYRIRRTDIMHGYVPKRRLHQSSDIRSKIYTSDMSTSTIITLNKLAGNVTPHLSAIQAFLTAHFAAVSALWWLVFVLTSVSVSALLGRYIYQRFPQQNQRR